MEVPEIKVLNQDLELIDEIDFYTSLDFVRSWQGVGDFSLTVCGHRESLADGNIIMLGGSGHKCGIIRKPDFSDNEKGTMTTVSGQTLNGFASQRIVLPRPDDAEGYFCVPEASASQKYVSAEEILKTYAAYNMGSLADTARKIRHLVIAEDQKRGIFTNWRSRYTDLDEALRDICEYCDCGYEIYIDFQNRCFVFDYLSGTDRSVSQNVNSRVILSKDFESVRNIRYCKDRSNFKNVAYCGGNGEGTDRTVLAVAPKGMELQSGLERYETFIDCGSLSSAETQTGMSLKEEGEHKLEEFAAVETLSADIASDGSFRYEEHWDLGDMVTVCNDDLSLTQDMRVSEVRESYESEQYSVSAVLGRVPKRLGRVLKGLKTPVK